MQHRRGLANPAAALIAATVMEIGDSWASATVMPLEERWAADSEAHQLHVKKYFASCTTARTSEHHQKTL